MISTSWIEKRKPYWQKLESLVASGSKGVKSLGHGELQELSLLYRQTAADLAAIRQDPSSVHFARYLNQLMARAHNIIYAGHRANPWAILKFFRYEYPRVFRQNLRYCALAFAIFIAGGLAGTALTLQDPDFQLQVLGPRMVHTIQRKEMWTHSIISVKPLASSEIMTNNMTVSFMTYATGITAGLGTLYMMFFNGLLMGVIGTACAMAGMSLSLWSFVAPHGGLELPAIFLAGGAGPQSLGGARRCGWFRRGRPEGGLELAGGSGEARHYAARWHPSGRARARGPWRARPAARQCAAA